MFSGDKRKLKYATDAEYREKERERVRNAKTKAQFKEWQRKYNRDYYHRYRKKVVDDSIVVSPKKRTRKPAKKKVFEDTQNENDPLFYDDEDLEVDAGITTMVDDLIEEDGDTPPNAEVQHLTVEEEVAQKSETKQKPIPPSLLEDIQVEYRCKRCNTVYLELDEAVQHLKMCQPTEYICGQCSQAYSVLDNLLRHISQEHPVNPDPPTPIVVKPKPAFIPPNPVYIPPNPNFIPKLNPDIKVVVTTKPTTTTISEQEVSSPASTNRTNIQKNPRNDTPLAQTSLLRSNQRPVVKEEPSPKKRRGRPPKVVPKPEFVEVEEVIDDEVEEEEAIGAKRTTRQSSRANTKKLVEQTINEALEDYVEEEVPVTGEIFICSFCDVSFLDEVFFQQHMDGHSVIPNHVYQQEVIQILDPVPGSPGPASSSNKQTKYAGMSLPNLGMSPHPQALAHTSPTNKRV